MAKRDPVIPGARGIYNMVARKRKKIINKLFLLMDDSNTNVALGASKCLAGKILPDLKATDLKIDGAIRTGVIILPSLNKDKTKRVSHSDKTRTVEAK